MLPLMGCSAAADELEPTLSWDDVDVTILNANVTYSDLPEPSFGVDATVEYTNYSDVATTIIAHEIIIAELFGANGWNILTEVPLPAQGQAVETHRAGGFGPDTPWLFCENAPPTLQVSVTFILGDEEHLASTMANYQCDSAL